MQHIWQTNCYARHRTLSHLDDDPDMLGSRDAGRLVSVPIIEPLRDNHAHQEMSLIFEPCLCFPLGSDITCSRNHCQNSGYFFSCGVAFAPLNCRVCSLDSASHGSCRITLVRKSATVCDFSDGSITPPHVKSGRLNGRTITDNRRPVPAG